MSASVLVTYATRYGSTKEVAEVVASTMQEQGLFVELAPVQETQALDAYQMVVLGAPLYMFHWHKDALHFLERHRAALSARPVAIFALGPLHDDAKEYQGAREQLDKELAKFPWLTPKAIAIFGGKLDPATFTFPHNLIPAMRNMPPSDVRDWAAIRAWAGDLATQFQPIPLEIRGALSVNSNAK
jgi:menaquinone-dependent protoporphyrinogen oxidase